MDKIKLPLGVEWWCKAEADEVAIVSLNSVYKIGHLLFVSIKYDSAIELSDFMKKYRPATQKELAEFFDYSYPVISEGAALGALGLSEEERKLLDELSANSITVEEYNRLMRPGDGTNKIFNITLQRDE